MLEKCDMCGSKIIDKKCDCGIWESPEETKLNPVKLSIDFFNKMERFTMTADAPHLGCAVVFFRGDYNDCKEVEKFIFEMKRRPFYESIKKE